MFIRGSSWIGHIRLLSSGGFEFEMRLVWCWTNVTLFGLTRSWAGRSWRRTAPIAKWRDGQTGTSFGSVPKSHSCRAIHQLLRHLFIWNLSECKQFLNLPFFLQKWVNKKFVEKFRPIQNRLGKENSTILESTRVRDGIFSAKRLAVNFRDT